MLFVFLLWNIFAMIRYRVIGCVFAYEIVGFVVLVVVVEKDFYYLFVLEGG